MGVDHGGGNEGKAPPPQNLERGDARHASPQNSSQIYAYGWQGPLFVFSCYSPTEQVAFLATVLKRI